MSQTRLNLLLMMWRLDMASSRATPRLERTGGTTRLSQCGCIEMMSPMVDIEARIIRFAPPRPQLLTCFPVCNVELSFVCSSNARNAADMLN
jgi:hypothetical protein